MLVRVVDVVVDVVKVERVAVEVVVVLVVEVAVAVVVVGTEVVTELVAINGKKDQYNSYDIFSGTYWYRK